MLRIWVIFASQQKLASDLFMGRIWIFEVPRQNSFKNPAIDMQRFCSCVFFLVAEVLP